MLCCSSMQITYFMHIIMAETNIWSAGCFRPIKTRCGFNTRRGGQCDCGLLKMTVTGWVNLSCDNYKLLCSSVTSK